MEVQQTVAGARKLATAGDDTAAQQMMAQAFEGLDDAVGVDPWEPGTFLAWAQEQSRSVELMASLSHRDRGDFVGQAEELRE